MTALTLDHTALTGLKSVILSGREVLPIVEGGKGVSASNGHSAGAFAAAGAVGTFSGVNADSFDAEGRPVPYRYKGKTRRERHEELIAQSIKGGITQAQISHEISGGNGRIHMNVLWEMGGTEHVLRGILDKAKSLIHGITCGAGMPYKLSQIASEYGVHYHPIVSSARAFRALWMRSYSRFSDYLGSVVYEDPWRAGGHNGLSNKEDPETPEDPYPRVAALRSYMNSIGLEKTPIIMAGGVWYLRDWKHWLNNPEIGPIAFQFGTRPLLTQESPIPLKWKQKLLALKEGDITLNKFSPTGFYSSAVKNPFMGELMARSERQIPYSSEGYNGLCRELALPPRGRVVFVSEAGKTLAEKWIAEGYSMALRTPDNTLVFVTPEKAAEITKDQRDCMGCLSACNFSNWSQEESGNTGRRADPRSYCIQKTLQDIAHGGPTEDNLMFAGHNAFQFADDPVFKGGHIPSVRELLTHVLRGD